MDMYWADSVPRVKCTASRIRESDLESLPTHVVERPPKTFRHADHVPENVEPVIVYRRLRPSRSHIEMIELWIGL